MTISLGDYKFKLEDVNEEQGFVEYKGKMEVSYDGEFLGIETWESLANEKFTDDSVSQEITLVGPDQANLLVGAILALLESYGESSVYNDEDIQEEYGQMVQKTKDAYAEETVKITKQ
jgi:hypothetical protein